MQFLKRLKGIPHYVGILVGQALIDPVEIFYVPGTASIYPIISKAGCSSLKLILIRSFRPDFYAAFPEIHRIDPNELTGGRVRRLMFETRREYYDFCRDKNLVMVIRDPRRRFLSAYRGYHAGINSYYTAHPAFGRLAGFASPLSLPAFVRNCCRLPDRLADRHFRSQYFYLPPPSVPQPAAVTFTTIALFGALNSHQASGDGKTPRLNVSLERVTDTDLLTLDNSRFRNRYREDFTLFAKVKPPQAERDGHRHRP